MALTERAKAALSTLIGLEAEGVKDLASTLRAELEALDTKNFTVIGEKRTETQKKQALEAFVTEVGKALNVEGDLEQITEKATAAASALKSERDTAVAKRTELETLTAEQKAKVENFELSTRRAAIASKASVDPSVFSDLFNAEDLEKFTESEDGKTLYEGKRLRDYVQADERLKRYESALFTDATPPEAPTTPPATPTTDKKASPALDYINRHYAA